MVIAGIMVLVGGGAPYWIISDPQTDNGSIHGSLVNGAINSLIKGYMGLYMACVESKVLVTTECEEISSENESSESPYNNFD
jgi:hypothetical protein